MTKTPCYTTSKKTGLSNASLNNPSEKQPNSITAL